MELSPSDLMRLVAHGHKPFLLVRMPAFLAVAVLALAFLRSGGRAIRGAALLRAAAFFCLSLALAGLAAAVRLPARSSTTVAVVDLSESMDEQARAWALRFVNDLVAALPPGDEFALITFAGAARVARPPGPPRPVDEFPPPPSPSATDIGAALETALAVLPSETASRVVLLSDGTETRGDARSVAARAAALGVRIDTAAPPRPFARDVAIEKAMAPAVVTKGPAFPLRLVVTNSGEALPVAVSLYIDGREAGRQQLDLGPGRSRIDLPVALSGQGSRRLRAEILAPGDALPSNNYREVTVTIAGPPQILLLAPRDDSPIAQALRQKGAAVRVQPPGALRADLRALLEYHAVIAQNVTAADLSPAALAALERYVRDFGGGFVLAGGRQSYGDTGFQQTALQHMLPLTLEPQREPPRHRDPLALIILIDRSNSMGYAVSEQGSVLPERDPSASKLHYAKAAALAIVRQLKDFDHLGVIAFDSQPYSIARLRPLRENRALLEELVPRLVENGGTDFYDALDWARSQLAASPIPRKHIILLTDGDTNRNAADHLPLIETLARSRITVTAIRIGDDVANLALLHDIAERTGGQFYHARDVHQLPELLLRDANAAMARSPAARPAYHPAIDRSSALVRGLRQPPALSGYAVARAKRRADVPIYVAGRARQHPLLGAWQYGLGRVAAFAADPESDAGSWTLWDQYAKFWAQVVRWAMREQVPSDYAVVAEHSGGKTLLRVATFDSEARGVLVARVHRDEGQIEEASLVPAGPRLFEAELPALPPGEYALTLLRRTARESVDQRSLVVRVPQGAPEPQEEFLAPAPNVALLEAIAQRTGGRFGAQPADPMERPLGARAARCDLQDFLVPLALALFLGDVAIRRLRLAAAGSGAA